MAIDIYLFTAAVQLRTTVMGVGDRTRSSCTQPAGRPARSWREIGLAAQTGESPALRLAELSARYTIYAPEIPGTSAGDPNAIHQVDSLSDLVLIYEDTIAKLELPAAAVVLGSSFGGMLALELASYFPKLFAKVVVFDPIGLWLPDLPIANWMITPASELPALLFKDPACPPAKAMFAPPSDPAVAVNLMAGMVWALGCTGKFVWPIPEKGLRARLHRVNVPTLIVWGKDDALIPVGDAGDLGNAIRGSRVEIVRDCGHVPQAEQLETTLALVRRFLESAEQPHV